MSHWCPLVLSLKSLQITSDDNDDWGFLSSSEDEAPINVRVTRGLAKGKGKANPIGNVALVPLDGVSFHSKEGASLWKYVGKGAL